MIRIYLLVLFMLFFNGCLNKHGISAKYYSDCKEYYDFQGYYHKECGDDDIITYETMGKEIKKSSAKVKSFFGEKEQPKAEKNVW
ncbi:hypothetical protein [Sulfurimonas hydrogeniphila]|uniref:hypothetical protein n=1 Tax=Sulfurimonas hydrogeniphila TaxID=2509341 RepID=UPI00125FDD46|nr:hypothetical protein [Sulfurimonas hydrogeniphila]